MSLQDYKAAEKKFLWEEGVLSARGNVYLPSTCSKCQTALARFLDLGHLSRAIVVVIDRTLFSSDF